MATVEQLKAALIKAHEAGDTESASLFANEIKKMNTAAPAPPESPREAFDRAPMLEKAGTALADVTRMMSNGLTFGGRDKLAALAKSTINGGSYEDAKQAERGFTNDARERAGSAAVASELLGGAVTGQAAAKGGLSLMERIPEGMGFLKRMAASLGAGAVEGGVAGGLDAAGNDKPIGEGIRSGTMMGAMAGPLVQGLSTGVSKVIGRGLGNDAPAPTLDELAAKADAGFNRLEKDGVQILPDNVADLNDRLRRSLTDNAGGPRRNSHPKIMGELDALSAYSPSVQAPKTSSRRVLSESAAKTDTTTSTNGRPPRNRKVDAKQKAEASRTSTTFNTSPDQGMSLRDLDLHRRAIRNSTRATPDEQMFGNTAISNIDDFARQLTPHDITAKPGVNIRDAVRDLEDTRQVAHRELKLREVAKEVKRGERQIDASDNRNPSDIMRGRIKNILNNDKKVMGYTDDEVAQMEAINKGTPWGNAMRKASRLSGSAVGMGVGSIGGAAAGGFLHGPAAGTVGAAGGLMASAGLRGFTANRAAASTDAQIEELLDMIARGRRKAPRRRPDAMRPQGRGAVSRSLTISGLNEDDD